MKLIRYIGKTFINKMWNSRMIVFLLLLLGTAWSYDEMYLGFVKAKEYPISWCIFPFYLTSYGFLSLFYFGIIYINSDIPFMQHVNMYQVIRMGRRRWALGQSGGIFVRSLAVTILTAVFAVLPFFGHIEWTNEWGKVIRTLATQGSANMAGFFDANWDQMQFSFAYYEILDAYTPLQLMAICLILCTLICTFLGLFMFLVSLFADRVFAVAGAFALVGLLFFVENTPGGLKQRLSYFIPVHWAEFAASKSPVSGYYRMPPLWYMITFLVVSIIVMTIVICLRVKHIEFHWENEDA